MNIQELKQTYNGYKNHYIPKCGFHEGKRIAKEKIVHDIFREVETNNALTMEEKFDMMLLILRFMNGRF